MKIESVRVENFKPIDTTEWVDFEDVSCFIGANEAGKTAFLEAIHKINPVEGSADYDPLMEYPRSDYRQYDEHQHEDNPARVASIKYELTDSDKERISDLCDYAIEIEGSLIVKKNYKNKYSWEFQINAEKFIESFIQERSLHHKAESTLLDSESIDEFLSALQSSEADGTDEVYDDFQTDGSKC